MSKNSRTKGKMEERRLLGVCEMDDGWYIIPYYWFLLQIGILLPQFVVLCYEYAHLLKLSVYSMSL